MLSLITNMRQLFSFSVTMTEEFIFAILNISKKWRGRRYGGFFLCGNLIFAKNSDRPLTEAQPLVVYPAGDHKPDEMVQCTYIKILQAAHTYRVLGSKPFWIWGFEHGMNEHHVVIGNEAVWAREPEEKEDGLLGMDLLRLGLERGRTAYEALHVITGLLKQYGQGGNAALGMEHRYNNAFLIADDHEAWILDTCGRR